MREPDEEVLQVEQLRLLDLAYDAIFVIDAAGHRITSWNGGAERMYGYSAGEALGRVSHQLLQTRHANGGPPAYEQVARTGHWEGRLIQRPKAGGRLLVDGRWSFDSETGRILEINRDITEHVAEQERFEILVSSVLDYGIFMLNPDGIVTSWNAGARRIKGYDADEIVGRHFSIFYTPEDVARGLPENGLRQAREQGRFEAEGWRVRKDASRFWGNIVITALRDPSGRLTGYAKVTRDITDKRIEQQHLQELEKAKSTFLNLAAHELRGPLSVIRGYVSLLADHAEIDRRTVEQKVLPALTAKTEEMSRLVDQMVEIARFDDGSLLLSLENVDLREVVERSVARFEQLTDVSHSIVIRPLAGEVEVRADPDRIGTILGNLLSNAVKYSPDGGTVTVGVTREGGMAKVTVADEGVGVPEDQRDLLFGRFVRLRSSDTSHVGGIGLGLYLSRELARLHHGELVLEETGNHGSRFALSLPLV